MKLFLVLAWLAGEIAGAVVGMIVNGGETGVLAYVGALIGAFAGAGVVCLVAKLMPEKVHELPPVVRDRPSPAPYQMPAPAQQKGPRFEPPVPGQPQPVEPVELTPPPEVAAPAQFLCPHCQNAIAWVAEYASQEVSCPHCEAALVVPQQA